MSTTLEKPPSRPTLPPRVNLGDLRARLSSLRTMIGAWFVVEGLALMFWSALGLAAASFLLDYFFRLDPSQRTFLLLVMVGMLLLVLAFRVIRPLSTPLSDDGLILEVERRHPELAESLISAVQFKRMVERNPHVSAAMIEATIGHGADAAKRVRFADVINRSGFVKNVLLLLASLAIVGGLVLAGQTVPHIARWFQRNILLMSVPYPQNTYLQVVRSENGVIRIPRGDDYTLEVICTEESKEVPDRVFIDFRDGRPALAMKRREEDLPGSKATFEASIANVIQPFQFRVRGGDERTDYLRVELVEPPAIEKLTLSVTLPGYAGGQTEALPEGRGPYFILPGSTLTLSAVGNKPLTKAFLAREGERVELEISEGKNVSGKLAPEQLKTGQYAIELTDEEAIEARRPTTFGLRIRPDREPKVRARLTGIGGMVTVRARLPISGRVQDDHGLTAVSVPYVWRGDNEERKEGSGNLPLPSAALESRTLDVEFRDILDLRPLDIPTGTGLTFYVQATDNDNFADNPGEEAKPNQGKSPDFTIRVVTDEELRSDLLRREKEQRQEFERLTKQQEELLTFSRELRAQLDQEDDLSGEQKQKLASTPKNQKLIATNSGSVAQRLTSIVTEIQNNRLEDVPLPGAEPAAVPAETDPDDEDRKVGPLETRLRSKIVEPLLRLQEEDFPEAVQKVENARRASGDKAQRQKILDELIEHQEAVVAEMKAILSEMSQAEGFQEAVNLLYEVDKMQREVLERTKKAKAEREKGILEGSGSSKDKSEGNEADKDDADSKQ